MIANSTPHKIVVIGGGYAGTVAANHLRMRTDVDITLVNSRPKFVERIRLHQFVAGDYDASVDYDTLLGDGIQLVVDNATRIDTASRVVELASGRALAYDHVIYAVGSTGAVPPSVPGASEFAYSVAEFEFAQRLRTRLAELPTEAAVTVVGGGLTGIETAAELAEQGRTVTLVCGGTLAPALSEPGRGSVATWLFEHGVTVLEGNAVAEVRQDAVVLADGAVRQSALTIWTAGFGVPGLAAASGLRVDELGRLLTDETLVSVDDDRIVAAGDAASPSGRPLRMSCQAAIPLGVQAANTVLSRIAGTAPAVIDQAFKGSCISLGRHAGTMQPAREDDTPLDTCIDGQKAAEIKEELCRMAVKGIGMEARSPGAVVWQKGGPRAARMVPSP
ncbi:NAD(P)/FAD-dependent oxidoreductase [Streptomyces sp. ME19-01-6]|uniref:NAD(P)/FAD-dependent oxidoreductase n=1 Tax=Streptomyces sp. ME19-01-6 TaxID=3028686 RepID=UPI0029A68364|nr:FAD-dependent oxidoreductase [Streptomyces sp. ME19-01-6]MDX3231141.1 FAD-dependent oxidoreductase [Streptomyces sp. ME19-01-6]